LLVAPGTKESESVLMNFILILLCLPILIGLYKRYVPVFCMSYFDLSDISKSSDKVVLDIRDYNVAYNHQVNEAINIPVAYLNRFYNEIPYRPVHLICSNTLDKNVGTRILRKKGFKVVSYSLSSPEVCNESNKSERKGIEKICVSGLEIT